MFWYLRDEVIFTLAHAIFFIWAWYIFLLDKGCFKKSTGIEANVKRGETSWGYFHAVFGLLAVFVLELINTTEALKGYKTISFLDLFLLLYLCYFSSWFRNKIVGFVSKSKELIEN